MCVVGSPDNGFRGGAHARSTSEDGRTGVASGVGGERSEGREESGTTRSPLTREGARKSEGRPDGGDSTWSVGLAQLQHTSVAAVSSGATWASSTCGDATQSETKCREWVRRTLPAAHARTYKVRSHGELRGAHYTECTNHRCRSHTHHRKNVESGARFAPARNTSKS